MPDQQQRVGIALVGPVAHQRTHVPLRVVVLVFGESVVNEKRRTGHQTLGQGADEGLGLGVDFAQVVVVVRNLKGGPQRGGPVLPSPAVAIRSGCHAAFKPGAAHAGQQLDRHRIQHLVAQEYARQLRGQGV